MPSPHQNLRSNNGRSSRASSTEATEESTSGNTAAAAFRTVRTETKHKIVTAMAAPCLGTTNLSTAAAARGETAADREESPK